MIVSRLSCRPSTMRIRSCSTDQRGAGAFEVRSQVALEPLLRKWTRMAQKAQPHRAIENDHAAACRIAGRTGERSGYNVADDPVLEQLFGKNDAARDDNSGKNCGKHLLSSEDRAGDGSEPAVGLSRLSGANILRRVDGARDASALGFVIDTFDGTIAAALEIA